MGLFKNNILIGIVVLILISAGGAYYLLRPPSAADDLLVSEGVGEATVGRELLASLLTLKSLKFNTDLFNDDIFRSFVDFSVQVPDEPYGRPNPFAPVGLDAQKPASDAPPEESEE